MSADWIRADWPAPANVIAGTTTRSGDIADRGLPGRPCWLNQVHGANVVLAQNFESPPDADAAVSRTSANVCVVRTADLRQVLDAHGRERTVLRRLQERRESV